MLLEVPLVGEGRAKQAHALGAAHATTIAVTLVRRLARDPFYETLLRVRFHPFRFARWQWHRWPGVVTADVNADHQAPCAMSWTIVVCDHGRRVVV